MSTRIHQSATLALLFFAVTGCAYRFTNEHIVRPEGIETLAVEAVYDTSREVQPHEMLWQALQDAVASDGHLILAPQSSADALMRAHLREASIVPAGDKYKRGVDRDPATYEGGKPPAPNEFRPLTRSGEIRLDGRIAMVVDVEVWSLRTRTLLMRRSYPMKGTFNAFYDGTVTAKENVALRYDEASQARFKALSESLARRVVKDLLVR